MPRRVIEGGLVVAPDGERTADLVLEGERIAAIEPPGSAVGGERVDARGLVVLPGGVDPHAHLLADVALGAAAAAYGGTTTVLSFTLPEPGESPAAAYTRARDDLVPLSHVDVGLHAYGARPDTLTRADLVAVRDEGAVGVKLFLAYPELGLMASDRTLYETLRDAAELGLLVQVHCENGGVVEALVAEQLAKGNTGLRGFVDSRPPEVETEAVARTLALAALARAAVYLVHLSTTGALELVRAARARGQHVIAEACAHHLALDESVYAGPGAERALIVPPLRARRHVEALWKAVGDGTLDAIGSDHAQAAFVPDPAPDFRGLPYGFPGVELRLPILLSAGRARGVPLPRLAELVAGGPARAFGLWPRKGALVPGADADVVLWDPEPRWTVGPADLHDGSTGAPYLGLKLRGRIRGVYLRGTPLVVAGELGEGPRGRYLTGAVRPPAVRPGSAG